MQALLVSFGIVFAAEVGDKSQLMALAFAARYPALTVVMGISLATAVVHAFAVAGGALLGDQLPTGVVAVLAGVAFFAFAAWTIRGDSLDEDDLARAGRSARSALVATAVAFFLAELGDKTMLATVTLATTGDPLGTWAGSTLGMVAADAVAIAAGRLLGSRLPDRVVRIGAALAFVAFGVILMADGLRSL